MVPAAHVFVGVLFAYYISTHQRHHAVFGASNHRHRSSGSGDNKTNGSNSSHSQNGTRSSTTSSNYFFLQPTATSNASPPSTGKASSSVKSPKVVKNKHISHSSKKLKRVKIRPDASHQNYDYHHHHHSHHSSGMVAEGGTRTRGAGNQQNFGGGGGDGLQGFSYLHDASGLPHHVFEQPHHHRIHAPPQHDASHYSPPEDHYQHTGHSQPHTHHGGHQNENYGHSHDDYGGAGGHHYGHYNHHGAYQQPNVIVAKPRRRRKGFTHHFDFFGTEDPWALFGIVACIMLALPLVKAVITLPLGNVLNNVSRLVYLAYLNRNGTRMFGLRSIDGTSEGELRTLIESEIDGDVPMDWVQLIDALKDVARQAIANKW